MQLEEGCSMIRKFIVSIKYLNVKDIFDIICLPFIVLCSLIYKIYLKIKKRKIWLISEGKNDARDNGYVFFEYIRKNHPDDYVYYAINKKCESYEKVNKLGNTVNYGGFKHWIYYLNADKNITIHKAASPNEKIFYVLHYYRLFNGHRIFLQHGVTMNYVKYLTYKETNFELFICGAKPEYEYIKSNFGYPSNNVCYLGLVYKKTEESNQSKNACCAAQMFLDSGDGMVFRGNVGPWWNPKTKEFHLSKQDALSMVSQSLDAFYTRFNYYPEEIFIHARTYFNDDEWDGFTEATLGKSRIIGVRIREVNNFKLYRDRPYCVPRGLMLKYDTHRAYLWTKGFIPRFKSQIGLEVPSPLDISITRGDGDILVVCKDILGLSKLNYNTCIYGDGVPVTLKFADSIGEILTATRNLHCGILPFKHYI